jgi:hypothetical protein
MVPHPPYFLELFFPSSEYFFHKETTVTDNITAVC